jgi:hypothetical protein
MLYANARKFPHDTVDGETVIIDSVHGRLFLLTGSGPWVWHRLVRGSTIDGLVSELESRFGADAGTQVRAFLASLHEHGMLTDERQDAPAGSEEPALADPFAPPQLEKYDEISDIIAMDPIHDVDPTKGWPHR